MKTTMYKGYECKILKEWPGNWYDLETIQKTEKGIIETFLSVDGNLIKPKKSQQITKGENNMEKTFSNKEQKEILENANFPEGLRLNQSCNLLLWTIFNKKKFYHLLQRLKDGMHIKPAYIEAKEIK